MRSSTGRFKCDHFDPREIMLTKASLAQVLEFAAGLALASAVEESQSEETDNRPTERVW